MSVSGPQEISLRPSRFEKKRLMWALIISLAFHIVGYGGYQFTRKVLPAWLERMKILASLAHKLEAKPNPPPPPQPTQVPLVFVQVNPETATPEPPKDAKFYSSQNSRAANPDTDKATDTPKISGLHPDLSKLDDPARHLEKTQQSAPQPEERAKPKPPPIGDLAMAKPEKPDVVKPEPELKPDTGKAERPRPRTLAEAKARYQTPGEQRKQEGGVRQKLAMSSLDTKATITGGYDTMLYEAVAQRWYDLIDQHADKMVGGAGHVVVTFKLHADGTITELTIEENTTQNPALGWLCYEAIHDISTPLFQPWPDEMKHVEIDPRTIRFGFTYD